jgi:hypothetical protein
MLWLDEYVCTILKSIVIFLGCASDIPFCLSRRLWRCPKAESCGSRLVYQQIVTKARERAKEPTTTLAREVDRFGGKGSTTNERSLLSKEEVDSSWGISPLSFSGRE